MMEREAKLQRSEIGLEGREPVIGYRAVIWPTPGRERIDLIVEKDELDIVQALLLEDAHRIGLALARHAVECGYNPNTDETNEVQS